ncbi:hypothetical protein, partial [Cylindrospermopsis raciborskii]|uniref:hypothetical protein n=1 Tax=Cylindrospermopsis raciborskii TaxID=77022 RepID=UPI0026EE841D
MGTGSKERKKKKTIFLEDEAAVDDDDDDDDPDSEEVKNQAAAAATGDKGPPVVEGKKKSDRLSGSQTSPSPVACPTRAMTRISGSTLAITEPGSKRKRRARMRPERELLLLSTVSWDAATVVRRPKTNSTTTTTTTTTTLSTGGMLITRTWSLIWCCKPSWTKLLETRRSGWPSSTPTQDPKRRLAAARALALAVVVVGQELLNIISCMPSVSR